MGAVKFDPGVSGDTKRCVPPAVTLVNIQSRPEIRYPTRTPSLVQFPKVTATVLPVYPTFSPGALYGHQHEFGGRGKQTTYDHHETYLESHRPL